MLLKISHKYFYRCCTVKFSIETKNNFGISSMFWLFRVRNSTDKLVFVCAFSNIFIHSFMKWRCVREIFPVLEYSELCKKASLEVKKWSQFMCRLYSFHSQHDILEEKNKTVPFSNWETSAHVYAAWSECSPSSTDRPENPEKFLY